VAIGYGPCLSGMGMEFIGDGRHVRVLRLTRTKFERGESHDSVGGVPQVR